ncbi:MAG: methylated-DNA--[protein]-cysteine S-methyltransferase [Bacteroidetes bacterium]|nr:methylated-DNA--[protein]-cysteine S-methyltransferase [Bacteroidota bacterium]
MNDKFVLYSGSPIGQIKITADNIAVNSILFVFDDTELEPESSNDVLHQCKKELNEYFSGKRKEFTVSIDQEGTEFQKEVWNELLNIPFGKTKSYLDMAKNLGDANKIRAVGSANGKNQISIIVPCHRVIGSNGELIGYAGGLWRKEWLLKHEREFSSFEMQMDLF